MTPMSLKRVFSFSYAISTSGAGGEVKAKTQLFFRNP